MTRTIIAAAVASTAGLALAQSDPAVLSFTYSDLNGSFDGSTFSADAQGSTSGDVTRLDQGATTADFNSNFVNTSLANAEFDISVSNVQNFAFGPFSATATGMGAFTLTDANGDTISGDLSGQWFRSTDGQLFFNGFTSGVTINAADKSFDGEGGTGFSTNFLGTPILDGTLVVLSFDPSFTIFSAPFSDISTQISGRLVPTPGAAAILGLAGLAGTRRRR